MRRPLIAANWKMYKTVSEAEAYVAAFGRNFSAFPFGEVVLCPPFTCLPVLANLKKRADFFLGAQNMHWAEEGAFTGEISALMLKELSVTHVILGHSERRLYFGEDNRVIQRKMQTALEHGLIPIFCLGETDSERQAGSTEAVLEEQLSVFQELAPFSSAIVAYEPVWAIGTGTPSTAVEAQEAASIIRSFMVEAWGDAAAREVRVLYGGSVKPENIRDYMEQPDIDGALVGGASLQADFFASLVSAALESRK